jgi:hypothetical protein
VYQCWWRICREINVYFHVLISHVLRFISICDLFTDSTSYGCVHAQFGQVKFNVGAFGKCNSSRWNISRIVSLLCSNFLQVSVDVATLKLFSFFSLYNPVGTCCSIQNALFNGRQRFEWRGINYVTIVEPG